MNALRLSTLACLAALLGSSPSSAEAQSFGTIPLVEYQVVIEVDVLFEQPWNNRRWSQTYEVVVFESTSHTQASDYAEMLYMTWHIDPELAEELTETKVRQRLGWQQSWMVGFRITDLQMNTINNWDVQLPGGF